MLACTVFVRVRVNSPCLRVRYSYGCRRIACVCVNAIRAEAEEWPVFACTLFVRVRQNSQCLRVRYSCGFGGVARVCVYAIRADVDE